ncbi:hypothetical protein HDV62DRAFT_37764 [Trichoderma sp. SZMC 28011]
MGSWAGPLAARRLPRLCLASICPSPTTIRSGLHDPGARQLPGQARLKSFPPEMIHVSIPGVFAWVPVAGCTGTGTDTDTCTSDAAGNLDWYSYSVHREQEEQCSAIVDDRAANRGVDRTVAWLCLLQL